MTMEESKAVIASQLSTAAATSSTALGTVVAFNPRTCIASADLDDGRVRMFPLTAFYGRRDHGRPGVGDRVRFIFVDEQPLAVLLVKPYAPDTGGPQCVRTHLEVDPWSAFPHRCLDPRESNATIGPDYTPKVLGATRTIRDWLSSVPAGRHQRHELHEALDRLELLLRETSASLCTADDARAS